MYCSILLSQTCLFKIVLIYYLNTLQQCCNVHSYLGVQFCPIMDFSEELLGTFFEMLVESRLIRCVLHNLGVFHGVFSVTHFNLELCVSYTCQLSVWFATSWHHPLTKLSFVEMLLFTQNHYLPEHRKLELNKRKTIQMTT